MEIPSEFRRNSSGGSGNSENFTQEMAESFQFREEIQSLMAETDLPQQSLDSPGENGSSFTALLGLSTNRAMELHVPESGNCPALPSPEIWTDSVVDRKQPLEPFSFSCLPTFPSNAALVKRAERFSVFAEESPQTSSDPSNSTENSLKLKIEPLDSDSYRNSSPIFAPPTASIERHRSGKRKEGEKSKVRAPAKKSKNVEKGSTKTGGESEGGEKLPYVHVRARRGQATDSHSLAERARREKINARMKLLQELVPGCNKISGTALVLDEIINHVQSLQRQVEILSMRLAAVNPRIDSSSLDLFFSSDNGSMTASSVGSMVTINPLQWPEVEGNGTRQQQQLWHGDSWQRDERDVFVNTTPEISLQGYDSGNSGSQRSSQLKMEL